MNYEHSWDNIRHYTADNNFILWVTRYLYTGIFLKISIIIIHYKKLRTLFWIAYVLKFTIVAPENSEVKVFYKSFFFHNPVFTLIDYSWSNFLNKE